MCKVKISKSIIGVLLVTALIISNIFVPLQSVFALDTSTAKDVTRGGYYDLPEAVDNYVTSGKTLEFDLNILIASTDVCKLGLYDGSTFVSSEFILRDGEQGLSMTVEEIEGGWYHYTISLASVPHTDAHKNSRFTRIRARSTFPSGTKINNISIGIDVQSLPEAFTDDYDTVTLADLGMAGTDYKTPVSGGSYEYDGKSTTKSVIVKFGWEPNFKDTNEWKIALDTYWNSNCMVWFQTNTIYFCPGDGSFTELRVQLDPITSGKHDVEFGRLRVTAGPNYGKDYVFLKVDGTVVASKYTKYYQTTGGYIAYNDKTTVPSYTVHFVTDGVSKQGFSGFAKPDEYVTDIDYVNIGDIVPGGVVKDTIHDGFLGYTYPFTSTSKTKSTVVKYVIKTGTFEEGALDGSVMVVDIGGNCGFCRAYIPSGERNQIMFGWEIDGCTNGTKKYSFESNSWYAVEQGRIRVTSGLNKGKDYIYLKINDELVSYFYGNPESRPFLGSNIYIEATHNIQIVGYDELRAKYYVDDELYLDQLTLKGFNVRQPAAPEKSGHYFLGWYTQKTGGKLFDFKNTVLTENINLYARFTTETVKATFNPANGSGSSTITVGKNCLVPMPSETPSYSSGGYEYVFAGWKNDTTGKIFNFETDRISADTSFTARYKEKEYYVSYYANGKLVKKVPFVLSNPTISGKEPAVPKLPNTTGKWEEHSVSGLTKSMTVNAVYTVKVPTSSTAVKLKTYSGSKIYLNTDLIHDYLSTDTSKQTAFVREYAAAPHVYQDHQNTSFEWTDSGKNGEYTIYFADNKNFKNPYIVTASKKSLINEVGIFVPGKTYYWFVYGNSTGKSSAVDSFSVVDTPVRYITAGKVTNMRDEGGRMTADGSKVKYGLVYRGASLDEFHSHLDDAARYVFNYLGMKSEIELRGGMDHDYTGWDENNPNVYYVQASAYESILTLSDDVKNQYRETFEAMANEKNYPFYFHCSAGADRTGAFGYVLNGLLGVPYEELREDYELTSFSEVGLRTADNYVDGSLDNLNSLMLEKYADGSGNLQKAIENYLKNYIGVSASSLDKIKEIMLEKNASPNEKPNKITVDVLGKKYTYHAYSGIYFMPETPKAMGKIFKGFYSGSTKYNGYTNKDTVLTAKFEDIKYETYDTVTLKDLGISENKVINQTNTVYTYQKTAKTGGRLLQFVLEPIGNMKNGDGPQIALTNDWSKNSYARVWFQTNSMSHVYHNGSFTSGPDISKMISLEAGKQYNIEYAVRVMTNAGYEGKKIFEVTVNGELLVQYIGCEADLSDNTFFFHGGTGAAYLINKPVYKTVKFYNGTTLIGTYKVERSSLLPDVKEPVNKDGIPFAGWRTAKSGGKLWDQNADLVYNDMSLYAYFADVKIVTANVDGKKLTYRVETGKTIDSIPKPEKAGYVFLGWTVGGKLFSGKVTKNMTVTAKFEAYKYQAYDTITLKDLGIEKDKILNQTNTVYTYEKTAKSGGRVLQFILEPIGNMKNGDGPQISFTNDWSKNSFGRVWFQTNNMTHIYYKGKLDGGPDISKEISLKAGKQYTIQYGIRVLANKGYEGIKVFEVRVDGQVLIQYMDIDADLSENKMFFHGSTGAAYLINKPVYKTVKFYNGNTLMGTYKVERSGLLPKVKEPASKGGLPFAGWRTAKSGGKLWDQNADVVLNNMSLYAYFADVKVITANVDGKKLTYRVETGKTIDSIPKPEKAGYVFMGWTVGGKLFSGKVTKNMTVTAKFEAYKYQAYDTITLKDLGIEKDKILNQTNTVYTYEKTAKSGGRVLQFILEPIGNMKNGDGPQISFTNDWSKNSFGRVWFQTNNMTHIYYKGKLDGGPDISKEISLKAGKQYTIQYGIRVLANKGYEGIKVLEIRVNGEVLIQYMDIDADLSENKMFFHGSTGAAYLINKPVYKTVKFYNGNTLMGTYKVERSGLLPKVKEPAPKGGLPFAGWHTAKSGGKLWDENADVVLNNMSLYAYFADVKVITANVDGKKLTYRVETGKTLDVIPKPEKAGYVFMGWMVGGKLFSGKVTKNMTITAKFEAYKYQAYDTITLKDLGIEKDKILNQTNTVYTYEKTAKSGGRVLQFILEPIGNMKNGDGPQISFTNDWSKNSFGRVWFQTNNMTHIYYKGKLDGGPDISKEISLEAGKQYTIQYGIRVLANKGYEGIKVLEIRVNGEVLIQYMDIDADLSENKMFFHGSTGAAYLINKPVYKTVKFYNGNTLMGTYKVERSGLLPKVKEPAPKGGLPFAGWRTAKSGGKLWDENADVVLNNMSLYAYFADVKVITANVDGKKLTYRVETGKTLDVIPKPEKAGYVFMGWTVGGKLFSGKVTKNMTVTAKFEAYKYQPYDTISLKDLGVEKDKILNQTNTVYTYEKTAESGGRVLQFILEPIGDMKNGDGPQIALTNDWAKNSFARIWFQTNNMTHIYYKGKLDGGPDISKEISLKAGKQYTIQYGVRVLANKGYEGIKVFEVRVNGEVLIQYMGCEADLSENLIYFHGGSGSAYLINKPVYKTVKFYNGNTLIGSYKVERCGLLPKVKEPAPKCGLPFAGWYTEPKGGKLWDENADLVYRDMSLYAHFANVKVIRANIEGKKLTYRVEVGKTLDELPKPQKSGHVFMGWTVGGKVFTGKVTTNMSVTALFEEYSFDDYDEISLRDLGIYKDLDISKLGPNNTANYTYYKAAQTGGRVFKAIYIPTENMINGPQISFSPKWDENYFAKLYFTKFDMLYVYSSGIDGGLPTLKLDTELVGGKEYLFEIGVRVLNNKGYKGVKVLTVYLNGKLIFEEFDNKANIDGADVFFQGMPNTGIIRNVDIYKTVSFYDGDKKLSAMKVLRGEKVKSYGDLADKGDLLFVGWFTEFGQQWNFDTDSIYLDTVLKAKFQKRTYPILLMVDGILYKRLNVFAGECAQIFDIPIKDGYEFDKWLLEDGSEYDMMKPINAPVTLVASFKEAPMVETETLPQSEKAEPIQNQKTDSIDMKYILFSIIGLVVIVTEIGIIIYKKRSKRS